MKIGLIGATGFVGEAILKQASTENFSIKVLARNPGHPVLQRYPVEIIEGNYFDKNSIERLLSDVEVLISTVGPPENRKTTLQAVDFEKAMEVVVEQIEKNGVERLIHIASAGTSCPGEKISLGRKLMRLAVSLVAPVVIPAKEKELAVLMKSNINWVSIRPPLIQKKVAGTLAVNPDKLPGLKVDVHQLADFILKNVTSNQWLKQAPFVGTVKPGK